MSTPVEAILFDKDGTLFDFQKTWAAWVRDLIDQFADGDAQVRAALCGVMGFDYGAVAFLPDSPVIAGTAGEQVALIRSVVPHLSEAQIRAISRAAMGALVPVVVGDLAGLLARLAARGVRFAVVTNDGEDEARRQIADQGLEAVFDVIIGYDSGWGGKPAPEGCLAAARALGVDPRACVMVGDSTHDLDAGRAAGMRTVAVLTGVAGRADLAPYADVVLDDIHGLAGLLGVA
ncbi:HAD family hydrolase [Celeribacter arenosi]|uniref:phosphoglycolate phosphatase n=1 Tax=Celeribacter arenosi TaxID=792649 RepID=A0ABP7JU00_9RHOB